MRRFGFLSVGLAAVLAAMAPAVFADSPATNSAPAPDFKEVFDLVRAHLAGATEAELDAAAARGLVQSLGPRVTLVTESPSSTNSKATGISRATVFDGEVLCLRSVRIVEGMAGEIRAATTAAAATNKLKGLILDLRYTRGDDYAAAAAVSDLFTQRVQPLLNWGNGVVESKEKDDALTLPVAVIVNRETTGGAEALAAMLREIGVSLILGSKTAGQARIAQEFALKNGDHLRIANDPVLLGDGSPVPTNGVVPDVTVNVGTSEERLYYLDPYRGGPRTDAIGAGASSGSQTNLATRATRRNRYTEAELVRDRRENQNTNADVDPRPVRDPEPEKPVVRDPALARALDLLKGLAVVRRTN